MGRFRLCILVLAMLAVAAPVWSAPAANNRNQQQVRSQQQARNQQQVRNQQQPNRNQQQARNQRSNRGQQPTVGQPAARNAAPAQVAVKVPPHMNDRQLREQIVHTAFSQLGLSYQRGGTTPRHGFDCSGFTNWVYAMVDVSLPRTSREQFAIGSAVDKAELAPGDLVFFRYGRNIGHVGLYVDNGYFIHSPNKNSEIMISSLSAAGWVRSYAGARRVVP